MATSGLRGPFTLSNTSIDKEVTRTSPGAYALGQNDASGATFHINYVGRSDGDVNARLKQHVGKYKQFKYEYYSSPRAAFEKECHLWHDFGAPPTDNAVHPARPANSGWSCPRCNVFD